MYYPTIFFIMIEQICSSKIKNIISCDKGSFSTSQSKARMGNTLSMSHPGFLFIEAKPDPF